MLSAGAYRIDYRFLVHPFLECDEQVCHWNLRLADSHLPYRRLEVRIHDPQEMLLQIFPHPDLDSRRQGDAWIITGSSARDEVIELEMLLKAQAAKEIDGFPRNMSDVTGRTLAAQQSGFDLLSALQSLMLLFPVLVAGIYYLFGREKHYLVPETLSRVPAKRKPWLVNLVFKGDAFDLDKDGFYATLLDLSRREIIKIDSTEGTQIILRTRSGWSTARLWAWEKK